VSGAASARGLGGTGGLTPRRSRKVLLADR